MIPRDSCFVLSQAYKILPLMKPGGLASEMTSMPFMFVTAMPLLNFWPFLLSSHGACER